METESVESGFLSIFALLTFFIFLIISKYINKFQNGILLDNDFSKPQAFHHDAISRGGGIAIFLSFICFLPINFLLFENILFSYLALGISLFFIGYLDDIKISLNPKKRLILMSILLIIFIKLLDIEIKNIDFVFLNQLIQNNFFSILFILLCFLFVINGANLVDGFNGLLTLNLIIINSFLLFINLTNNHLEFSFFLTAQLIILITFLLFNFPKAKIFLGDSGSYFLGTFVALNVITTNNLNPNVSSFFFCILLFYLFFEVFFSFVRKVYQKKSPVFPDDQHLHMLSFKIITKKTDQVKGNYLNSLIINLFFLIMVFPSIYFADNSLICKYWFISLVLIYLLVYKQLYQLTKNQN